MRTQKSLPNGITVDQTYDTLDRLTGIERTTSSVLASYDCTLNAPGNRLGVTEADGSSLAWFYDDAYRLIGETRLDPGGSTIDETSFTYDPVGNPVSLCSRDERSPEHNRGWRDDWLPGSRANPSVRAAGSL